MEKLEFNVTKQLPDNVRVANCGKEDFSEVEHALSSLYKNAVDAGIIAREGCLLKCNVPTSALLVGNDGKFQGTIVNGGNRFQGQARFSANDIKPLAIAKIASAVTGEYQYCIIMKKLDSIAFSINELLWAVENDKIASLLQCYKSLRVLALRREYNITDKVAIDNIVFRTGELLNGYMRQLQHISQQIPMSSADYSHCWNVAYSRFSCKLSRFQSLGFNNCVDGIRDAHMLYLAALNVKMRILSMLGSSDHSYMEQMGYTYKEYQQAMSLDVNNAIANVRGKLMPVLKHFREHAWIFKGKMDKKIAVYNDNFTSSITKLECTAKQFSTLSNAEAYFKIESSGDVKLIGIKDNDNEVA